MMMRLDWPRPPLLLGLVLGGLAENRLFLSLSLYGWDWWRRPGVLIIGLLVVTVLLTFRTRRPGSGLRPGPHAAAGGRPSRSADALFALAVAALGVLAFAGAWAIADRAGMFPRLVSGCVIGLAVSQAIAGWRRPPCRRGADTGPTIRLPAALWLAALGLAIWLFGFGPGSALATVAYLRRGARESWSVALLYGVALFTLVDLVFGRWLAIPFPAGLVVTGLFAGGPS
jgi:hypothetical protein